MRAELRRSTMKMRYNSHFWHIDLHRLDTRTGFRAGGAESSFAQVPNFFPRSAFRTDTEGGFVRFTFPLR